MNTGSAEYLCVDEACSYLSNQVGGEIQDYYIIDLIMKYKVKAFLQITKNTYARISTNRQIEICTKNDCLPHYHDLRYFTEMEEINNLPLKIIPPQVLELSMIERDREAIENLASNRRRTSKSIQRIYYPITLVHPTTGTLCYLYTRSLRSFESTGEFKPMIDLPTCFNILIKQEELAGVAIEILGTTPVVLFDDQNLVEINKSSTQLRVLGALSVLYFAKHLKGKNGEAITLKGIADFFSHDRPATVINQQRLNKAIIAILLVCLDENNHEKQGIKSFRKKELWRRVNKVMTGDSDKPIEGLGEKLFSRELKILQDELLKNHNLMSSELDSALISASVNSLDSALPSNWFLP